MHYGDCQSRKWDVICGSGRDPFNQNFRKFRSKTHGSVRSNRKRFDITGPPFEVDHFSRSDRSKFWMNGLNRAHCDVSLPGLLASVACVFRSRYRAKVGASKPKKWTKREGKWGKRKLSLPHPF